MSELGTLVSRGHLQRIGRGFRLATVLVLALSCAPGDAGTLLAPVANPLDLAVVQITPEAVTLPSGGSYQFTALAILPGSVAIVPDVIWTATGGTISASGLFTAGATPGTYQISAQIRGRNRTGSAPVNVAPSLTSLVLNPAAVTLAEGATQQFTVAGTWNDGSATVPAVTYTGTGGTVTASGLYTAGATPGSFSVIATQQNGTKADTVIVTIAAPAVVLLQMVLTPASLALAPAGTAQFSVTGTSSDGSSSAPAVTYSATGGTVTASGLYTAGATAGTFRVIATQTGGSKVDTSVVTITAVPPTLTQMVLSPTSVALAPAGTAQFSVAGTWSDGTSSAPAVTYSATGGTITAGGLYTAGAAPGYYRVVAVQQRGTKADTATLTVISPPATTLALVGQPGGAVSGAPLVQQPVVELRDPQNRIVAQAGVLVTATISTGGGTLAGPQSAVTNSAGQAVFSNLSVVGNGAVTLDFNSPGLTKATSQAFTVTPSAPLVVNAGINQTVGLATGATLSATVSSMLTGSPKMYWSKVSGPGTATFGSESFSSSFEDGTVNAWIGDGGGNQTGGATVSQDVAHSGSFSWKAYNDPNLPQLDNYSAKLLRWRFDYSAAYYSAWYYWPTDYKVNGVADQYVNIFQFKERMSPWDPTWIVAAKEAIDGSGLDDIVLHDYHGAVIYRTTPGTRVPKGRWFHIVAYMKVGRTDGTMTVWLDDAKIFDLSGLNTVGSVTNTSPPFLMWGVGNYGKAGIGHSIYVDDASVIQATTDPRNTTVQFSAPGVYLLRLTANDGQNNSSSDVQITVK